MKTKFLQIILLLITVNVSAQTTIENFAYGTITGSSADSLRNPMFGGSVWRRHNATAGGPVLYSGTSLSYAGYASSGVGGSANFIFATGTREDINRSTIAYTSGSVYASFLLNLTSIGGTAGDYFFHFMDTVANSAFRGRVFIKSGSVANTFNIGLSKLTTTPLYSLTDYPLNSTILVVVKYKFDLTAINNDSVTAYVFTSGIPTIEPNLPTLIASDITNVPTAPNTGDLTTLNSVAIRQGTGNTMNGTIDGIRVSNTWGDGPLPVKLASYEANLNNETTLLSWSTSSEINNKGFEIERSMEGKIFETIGFVKGNGNSNVLNSYSFKFESNESAFYRLKQIDFDGVYEYSKIVFVSNEKRDDKSEFLPNPFVNEISIVNNEGITKAEIMDITGKLVLSEEILNLNKASINTMSLKAGMYYLKIYTANSTETKRVIKNN